MSLYFAFPKRKEIVERLNRVSTDGLRWRWWVLFRASEIKVFPGLVAEGLRPLSREEIVKRLYQSEEFKDLDRLKAWEKDKVELLLVGLIDIAKLNGQEYIWMVDYHLAQVGRYKKIRDFYTSFLSLQDEREKALFLALLSKFKPKRINLNVFSIPEYQKQFEDFVSGRQPVFYGGQKLMKGVLEEIDSNVRDYLVNRSRFTKNVKDFIQLWIEKVREKTGRPYFVNMNDFKKVRELLDVFSENELEKMADFFFNNPPVHVKVWGYTIGVFYKTVNRLLMDNKRSMSVN